MCLTPSANKLPFLRERVKIVQINFTFTTLEPNNYRALAATWTFNLELCHTYFNITTNEFYKFTTFSVSLIYKDLPITLTEAALKRTFFADYNIKSDDITQSGVGGFFAQIPSEKHQSSNISSSSPIINSYTNPGGNFFYV